jgi:hypothetical protein
MLSTQLIEPIAVEGASLRPDITTASLDSLIADAEIRRFDGTVELQLTGGRIRLIRVLE